jgi:hypothetical protein
VKKVPRANLKTSRLRDKGEEISEGKPQDEGASDKGEETSEDKPQDE